MQAQQSVMRNSCLRSSKSMMSVSQRHTLFKNRLESMKQYISLLEDDPQEASLFEAQCERNFYKSELKTAMAINFALVKLVQEKQAEICGLLSEIREQRKQQYSIESPQKRVNNENSQVQVNRMGLTPKQHIMRAFEAQKQILGARYSQQKELFRKKLERREQMLKSSKEQNLFLRQKLIEMGERLTFLQQQNNQLKAELRGILKSNTLIAPQQQSQINARVLNFSPIREREQDLKISFEEISFNQTPQKHSRPRPSHPQDKQQPEQANMYQRSIVLADQAGKARYYEELQRQYVQLKEKMLKILTEVEKYRLTMQQLEIHHEDKIVYRQQASSIVIRPADEILTRDKQLLNHRQGGQECTQCLKLQILNDSLYKDLQRTREDLAVSKVKLEGALLLGRKQQEEWSMLLNDDGLQPKD